MAATRSKEQARWLPARAGDLLQLHLIRLMEATRCEEQARWLPARVKYQRQLHLRRLMAATRCEDQARWLPARADLDMHSNEHAAQMSPHNPLPQRYINRWMHCLRCELPSFSAAYLNGTAFKGDAWAGVPCLHCLTEAAGLKTGTPGRGLLPMHLAGVNHERVA